MGSGGRGHSHGISALKACASWCLPPSAPSPGPRGHPAGALGSPHAPGPSCLQLVTFLEADLVLPWDPGTSPPPALSAPPSLARSLWQVFLDDKYIGVLDDAHQRLTLHNDVHTPRFQPPGALGFLTEAPQG